MELHGIDHFNVRGRPQDVDALRDFYRDVLGLRQGARPAFKFPGYWMYLGETPVVHISGSLPADGPAAAGAGSTGRVDHISFRAQGFAAVCHELGERGISCVPSPVPGMDIRQLFFVDPAGLKVELTFYGPDA